MNNKNFKLLKGGMYSKEEKIFVSAYITNTRLMGVMVMCVEFLYSSAKNKKNYQYFYFNNDIDGFETFESIDVDEEIIDTEMNRTEIENSLIGGLGAKKVKITKKEAIYILRYFIDANKKNNMKLPLNTSLYQKFADTNINFSKEDEEKLKIKICEKMENANHVINYFLMRLFANDFDGAGLLSIENLDKKAILSSNISGRATLLKNVITILQQENGEDKFFCESIVEEGRNYLFIVTELTICSLKVSSCELKNIFSISSTEVAMSLMRGEYINTYEVKAPFEIFIEKMSIDYPLASQSMYSTGVLFMDFNKTNDHVKESTYYMGSDVSSLCYLTAFDELVVCAYSEKDIKKFERNLLKKSIYKSVRLLEKYEFNENIFYDFIQSEYESFDEYVDEMVEDNF